MADKRYKPKTTRQLVLAYYAKHPTASLRQVAKALGKAHSVVVYHLQQANRVPATQRIMGIIEAMRAIGYQGDHLSDKKFRQEAKRLAIRSLDLYYEGKQRGKNHMKTHVVKHEDREAKYLLIEVPVNYNDEDMPYDAPLRDGDMWRAKVDLDTHQIEGWPAGKPLSFDMKVVDEGVYTILDKDGGVIFKREQDYVPNCLLPGRYGDYLVLDIAEDGTITNWLPSANLSEFEMAQ